MRIARRFHCPGLHNEIEKITTEILKPMDKHRFSPSAAYKHSMVLLLGNHSSGKSTFINNLLHREIQNTGVAPTDDGFTVIVRSDEDADEDGPTSLSNEVWQLGFLERHDSQFVNRFRLKKRKLTAECKLPPNIMVVDSPGMIDSPISSKSGRDSVSGQYRSYDFLSVVRDLAERSDLILFLFDPYNPGTTGESLDVLTKSLSGLEHKTKVILNKADILSSPRDLARVYGTLCWNLSKCFPIKDVPAIIIMANRTPQQNKGSAIPLTELDEGLQTVLLEVSQVPIRRLDNLITDLNEASHRIIMAAEIGHEMRMAYTFHLVRNGALVCGGLGLTTAFLPMLVDPTILVMASVVMAVGAAGASMKWSNFPQKAKRSDETRLDIVASDLLKFSDSNDARAQARWVNFVKPRMLEYIRARGVGSLPFANPLKLHRLRRVVKEDVPRLRHDVEAEKRTLTPPPPS